MILANRVPRLFQVKQHSRCWLRPDTAQLLSTSADPSQPPSRRRKEVSEQAIGGTTDDIAHSQGAFDSNEANPQKSASKISSVRLLFFYIFSPPLQPKVKFRLHHRSSMRPPGCKAKPCLLMFEQIKGGISMEQSAAYDRSSLSSEKTSVQKKAPNTQK
ncbi:hypothetical protein VP01_2985g8 [Puccinia sorghi]|uniref:Uncharacterized protein n=1 Tax=Puccinia sorghi TaxID=27349 RepID=A0A0L6V1B9_9BASI|nr:hypothetical protein VP01_2985g8 [Puccinia sorghi]